ncbi:MAG: DNA polymerase [Chloroflexota bacterium]|nr:DNA polymerase [Chloroflexota bacterium]MDQ5864293.1 DNA polymerase [Chloroflexota bacterium]
MPSSALCEHCGAALPQEHVESRLMQADLGLWPAELLAPEVPFAEPESVTVTQTVVETTVSIVPKKRHNKRGDDYYYQLYFDYTAAAETTTEDAATIQANTTYINGNAAPTGANNGNGNGHGNGHHGEGENGNGNGNGSGVDLAITETVPFTFFGEGEGSGSAAANAEAESAKVTSPGNYNDFEYELINDPSRLAQVAELLAHETVLGVDTETTGLDPHVSELLLLQVATADKVYIVDCRRVVPIALKPLLENPNVLKIAQNAKFEYEMLKQQCGITLTNMYDTMLAERICTAGLGREISLKQIAARYVGAVLDKSVREAFYKLAHNGDAYLAPEQLHYAARDAFIMIPIWHLQKKELERHKLEDVAKLEFQCIAAVGDLELAGVQIDVAKWRKIIEDVAVQREKSAVELSEMLQPATMQATMFGIPSINLNSSTQLMEVFGKLGVVLPDTSEATLSKFNHPAVAKLLEYRSHEKTLSAFGENVLGLINPKTGRIHPDFNQHGADTGRFSCIAGETLISTTHGLKRMNSVQPGDLVQTSFGPREVLAAWSNGTRALVKVTLSDGRELRLTPDHRVLTGNGNTWQAIEDLAVGDNMFLSLRGADLDEQAQAPAIDIDPGTYYSKKTANVPKNLSVPLCELAGLITADGTFAENRSHRAIRGKRGIRFTAAHYDRILIDFGWEDDELINLVTEHSRLLFGTPFVEHPHKSARRLQLASTQVSNALANLGLSGTAHTKKVPEAILAAPASFQAAYLRGLFEGDGYISAAGDHIGLVSVNRVLLESAQTMLSFLGCHSSIRKRKDTTGFSGSPRYELSVPGSENIRRFMRVVGFMSARKSNRASEISPRSIGSVTPIRISGAKLYRGAISQGLVVGSRETVKPFIPLYKGNRQSNATLDRLLREWGPLPELEQARTYRERDLYCLQIVAIEADGVGPVYDLTVSGVSEFLANGVVVHNCTRPNVQQIPATSDFRKCFVASEGYKLITCDYSQAELRILAELSGDPGFVGAFQSGGDLHSLTASQMFNVPLEQVQKSQRSAAKAINFGLAYGMGPGGLAPRLGVTLDEAKELIARYFKAYPGVQQWLDKAARDAVRNGYSVTMLGRKRFYSMPDEGLKKINEDEWRKQIAAIERQGKNSPIQGCVSGDTRIFEETRGYAPIASMRGEVVSVWDGSRFSQAVVVYSGKKQRVKVHLWDGNYIECSPDHRFLVRPTTGNDLWRTPVEFKPQQRIVLGEAVPTWGGPIDIPAHSCNGSWNAKDTSLGQISDPAALGEWLGRLASDGTVTFSTASLMVAEHEEVLLPRLQAISAELGHVGHSIRSTESRPKRFHKLTVSSRGLAQQLHELGIKERVPDCAWQDSRVLAGYLRGLFDGDGTVNTDGAFLVFGQRDKHLAWAREVQQALLLFGVRSRINVCADRVNVRIVKKDMPLFCRNIGFMNPAKQAKAAEVVASPRNKTYGRGVRVKSVEFTDEWIDMYDVVNSETSRFMANGLVVHNCNADMTKLALVYLRNALRDWDARTVNTVHDEIVVEARADIAEDVQHIVEDCMVRAAHYILKVVPMVAEASVADYWSK